MTSSISQQTMNILRLSFTMMILFTAILSHEFIMEPLLHGFAHHGIGGIQDKDGYLALCIVYFFNTLSCFFSSWLVTKVSGKWAMVVGMVTVLAYQFCYLIPNRYSILITSALVGTGTTFLWVGQGQYVSENVTDRNRETNTSMQWAFFKMSLIYGGLFFFFYFQNGSIETIVASGQFKTFLYIFIICTVFSIVSTCFLPQSEMSKDRTPEPFFQTTKNCWKLLKTRRMCHLFVFFFYTGLVKSFWISIYPACIKFTSVLAANTTTVLCLAMISTGGGQVLGAILMAILGDRIRKCGQYFIIIMALVLHIVLFLGIALTFPNDAPLGKTDQPGPVFQPDVSIAMIISFLLGFGDAILQTQVYSYIAKYYQKDSGTVFSIFRFSSGIASTFLFFAAQYFYLVQHLSLLAASAVAAGFAVVAFQHSLDKIYNQKSSVVMVSIVPRSGSVVPLPPVRS